jgi:Holliday junction DNA helicase RuvA
MLTRLTGKLESIEGHAAILATSGGERAYQVLVPAFLAERLQGQCGSMVTLVTFEYLESQGQGTSFIPRVVGFQSASDRRFFELFTTVKGIGNRKALRAMALEPSAIARAIIARDAKALSKLPEIGKRLAETIIAELHGKVDAYLTEGEVREIEVKLGGQTAPAQDPVSEEAVQALIALGETRVSALERVALAVTRARRAGRELANTGAVLEAVFGPAGS